MKNVKNVKKWIVWIGVLWCAGLLASVDPRYDTLVHEMRCVTCPNQSIADSSAPIAVAMREDIARRLEAGESEESIRAYLLSRYGDYISYRPPVRRDTGVLWAGPFVVLLFGVWMWWRYFSKSGVRV